MPARVRVLACRGMGSSTSKPRRKKKGAQHHPQHLPKVGSATENERLLHEEQHAVMEQMGFGGAGTGAKTFITIVIVVLVVGALLGLTLLTVWR
jgi:hypothetical protein